MISINNATYSQCNSSQHFNDALVQISEYIASDKFVEMKDSLKYFQLTDSLYEYSMLISDNDISEALLALTFATLPYYEMPIEIPFVKLRVNIPLPSTSLELFRRKLLNLPSNLFFDVKNYGGDKDKLTHFFGNAFLSYNIRIFNLSKFMSIFVELFEHAFKVEGAIDFRDLQLNMLGEIYGNLLISNNNSKPSDALVLFYLFYTNITL